MRPNILSMAAILTAALLTYLFFEISTGSADQQRVITLCISGFISLFIPMMGAIGISYPDGKIALNVRALSFVVVILMFLLHLAMAFFMFNPAFLIVPAGLILVGYMVLCHTVVTTCE